MLILHKCLYAEEGADTQRKQPPHDSLIIELLSTGCALALWNWFSWGALSESHGQSTRYSVKYLQISPGI